MLSFDEIAQLAGAVCATAETLGQTLSASAAELMAHDLADYPVSAIAGALQACRRELTGKLTLAAILQRVQAADGHPEANEAWAIAVLSSDETDSVLMTGEIGLAFSAARPVFDAGDLVAARMAFIAAYQRLVDIARRESTPANWALSLGFDPQRRVAAVEEGLRLGRLSAPAAREHIARLTQQPITPDGAAIAGLLTGAPSAPPSPALRDKWQEVKREVERATTARKEEQRAALTAKQEDLQRRRDEHQAATSTKKESTHA